MTDEPESDSEPAGRVPSRRPEQPQRRVPPPQPPPGERGRTISADISPRHIRLVPGQTDTATVTIRYHGAVVDELTLSISGETAGWARIAPDVLNVYPDTQAQSTIRFAPPRGPQPAAGLLELQLEVASRSDPTATIVQQSSIEIEPFDELAADADGATALTGKREAALPIKLRNLGNRPATVGLRARDAAGAITSLSTPSVVLGPGEETTVWATIHPKQSMLLGNPRVHPFTVTLSSDRSPPLTIDGRFEQLPTLGRARLGLAAVIAAGVLALAVAAVIGFGGLGPKASPSPTVSPSLIADATTAPPSITASPSPGLSTSAPTTEPPTTSPPTTAPPSTPAATTPAPTTPGPPTPVPTISAVFLKDGAWTLTDIDFPPILLIGFDPDDIESTGSLTFSDGVGGLVGKWSLAGASRSIICTATYGPGDQLLTVDVDYDGPFIDPVAGSVQSALCGATSQRGGASPFTVTTSAVPRQIFTMQLTMTNAAGTTITWRRTSGIVIPSLRLP